MRVLTFGWEFPPHNSGGLGVACEGLAKALAQNGVDVLFVLPKKIPVSSDELELIFADNGTIHARYAKSELYAYKSTERTVSRDGEEQRSVVIEGSLIDEVKAYGEAGADIAESEEFDIIHAHDWLSYCAGIQAKKATGKPLVVHVHATEYDRTGGHGVNEAVFHIEQQGMKYADRVVTVSGYTKSIVVEKYGIDGDKIDVVHNGVDTEYPKRHPPALSQLKEAGKKIVLFLGRKTIQKGPDYFLAAAKRALEVRDDIYFVMAGSGDMENDLIEMAADLGISDKVIFADFLRGDDVDRMYQTADVYVMPSISEPFGITPLESLMNETPVIISKQSGVSEVLTHALKVDFWDTEELANKIIASLTYDTLHSTLRENGCQELESITWDRAAKTTIGTYQQMLLNNS